MRAIKKNRVVCMLISIYFLYLFTTFFENSISSLLINNFIFFGICLYGIKKEKTRKPFLALCAYFFVYFCFLILKQEFNLENINRMTEIFFLPVFLLFINYLSTNENTNHSVLSLFIITSLFFLLFKREEFLFSILLFLPFVFSSIMESNNYLYKLFYLSLFFFVLGNAHNFLFYLSFLFNIFYIVLIKRKKIIQNWKQNNVKDYLFLALLLGSILSFLPSINLIEYSKIEINALLYDLSNNYILENSKMMTLFGTNIEANSNLLTIFLSVGIIGSFMYFLLFFTIFKTLKKKKRIKFILLELVILSLFNNLILTNSFIAVCLGCLFFLKKEPKKDILLVSNMYPSKKYPHYGVFVKNTYELLKENGKEIDLVMMHKKDTFLGKVTAYFKLVVLSFIKSVINNYQYIYVHFASHTPLGILIPYLFSKNTKFVLNVHGNDVVPDTKEDQRYLLISKIAIKLADILIAPSNYFKKILIKDYQVISNKIVVYPAGGIDVKKFHKIEKKKAKQNLDLDEKTKYLAFVARIEKEKGYDIFIKALANLKKEKKLKEYKFLLIGTGTEEPLLNQLIEENHLEKEIIRKTFLTQEMLVSVYNATEAFIYPTRRKSESLGLTGLEALACEAFVIGSNKYGPQDYLKDKVNSLTFNPTKEKELQEKINEFLNMTAKEKEKLTKNGRKTALKYSKENTQIILEQVFTK